LHLSLPIIAAEAASESTSAGTAPAKSAAAGTTTEPAAASAKATAATLLLASAALSPALSAPLCPCRAGKKSDEHGGRQAADDFAI
jgi:hypothetical protein